MEKQIDVIVEDFRLIEKLIRHVLIARGYQVRQEEPEVVSIEKDTWTVSVTFEVRCRR